MSTSGIIVLIATFLVVAIASRQLAGLVQKIHLPIITGLLIMGIICGPYVLGIVPKNVGQDLNFINEMALAFIAFAAAAELHLKELRDRLNSIKWMTFGQLVVTFGLSTIGIFVFADKISFMAAMSASEKFAVAILIATIFVARSPASAIAVINEMRAKGPFTQTAIGVTVLKDFLVILLFSICYSVAKAILTGEAMSIQFFFYVLLELGLSFGLGYILGRLLELVLSLRANYSVKVILIILLGSGAYFLSHQVAALSLEQLGTEIHLEALLICIIGSFYVTNYTRYRPEFVNIVNNTGPIIYVAFFTLAGASLSIDVLAQQWEIAFLLFALRLVSLIIGAFVGGTLAGDSFKMNRLAWMPYVTQAGVGLGLATVVAAAFPAWGNEFTTLIVAVIVINQIIGPPLFKWSINMVGESHVRASTPEFDGIRDAIIFGLESQSIALARQLQENGWLVKIVTLRDDIPELNSKDLDIRQYKEVNLQTLQEIETDKSEAIVALLTDDENYRICELIYEKFGVNVMVVRLNNRENIDKFHKLGALIVDPSTAIVSLMDHFVRSPQAASLLLGMQKDQDTISLNVLNPNLHGIALRDLRLPSDVIILSVSRAGQMIISHGYTRLRRGDEVSFVGSRESLEKMKLLFDR
jgi:Trk K+ transport system NAD-binding subunit/Kef-type K+ transport system membrane component KefB